MKTDYHSHRRYIILNMINHMGPISRKKLIEFTDYRPASVTELTKELIDEGLVIETGSVSGGSGRRRTLLTLNIQKLCAIGVFLSYTHVVYILSQLDGTIVERIDGDVMELQGDALADRVVSRVKSLITGHPERTIVGIGLGDPLYDPARYDLAASLPQVYEHFTDWGRLKLKPRLEEATCLPVSNFSAVYLPAVAEQHFGQAKNMQDFICVELGNGIGSSIISGGKVVMGYQGRAGELGHTTINFGAENRSMCYCGKAGCVEADAAFPYISRNICAALKNGTYSVLIDFYDGSRPLTVQDVRRGLDAGDILCEHYVRESARRIGAAVANAVNLLNPEMVVFYGFMTELGDFFIDEIRSILRRNTLVIMRDYQVAVSSQMETLMPLGAAAEMFNEFLHTEDYSNIYRLQKDSEAEDDDSDETEDW